MGTFGNVDAFMNDFCDVHRKKEQGERGERVVPFLEMQRENQANPTAAIFYNSLRCDTNVRCGLLLKYDAMSDRVSSSSVWSSSS